ncbi:MAG: aminoacyl-tRNA hydrolase, partial [Anaerolineales bacterium]
MTPAEDTFLIAGLGNTGRSYRGNRHNVGFMFIDQLADSIGLGLSRMQMKAITASGQFAGKKVILAKPQTMMNLSGEAVGPLTRYYRIPLENIYVVYDDLDLPHAGLRLKPAGG